MMSGNSQPPGGWRTETACRDVVAAVLIGGSLIGIPRGINPGLWLPYVWGDLAVTYVVAWWLGGGLCAGLLFRAGLAWPCAVALPVILVGCLTIAPGMSEFFWAGWLLRMFVSLLIVVWGRLVAGLLLSRQELAIASGWRWGVAIGMALLLPTLFEFDRVENGLKRLGERIDQQRLGTARQIAAEILAIHPTARFRKQPLRLTERKLRMELTTLKAQCETLESTTDDPSDALQRAMYLAMCSKFRASETAARELVDCPPVAAEACLLLGTLYEERGEWKSSREWYVRAKSWLERQSGRDSDIVRALHGIAFAERKLGHRTEAETAYLSALKLAPTAGSHYLLAQFYEDIQRAQESANHARAAIRLDPAAYRLQGEALIDKLLVNHTGCFSIYRSNRGNQ